jgi:exopolysaccharide biosynthesis polyprenyl glycosylphosphotransferase
MVRQLDAEFRESGRLDRAAMPRRIRVGHRVRSLGPAPPAAPLFHGALESRRRDAVFRRSLAISDALALMAAFALTSAIANEIAAGVRPRWYSVGAIPIFWLAAKVLGLYDRDEVLVHKTTLDEVPTVFQLATLCGLLCWLAHSLVFAGQFKARDALVLWLLLTLLITSARALARALTLRLSGSERCLFIGDVRAATAVRDKLGQGSGVRATVVAHVQVHDSAPWSSSAFSIHRLEEIRELIREMNLHRVIIAPANDDAAEMHDLVHTFDAVGVRVTIVPRVLEVAGTAVEFDDLHGLTVMGMRRFRISGSAGALKRVFDLAGATLILLVISPLLLLIAIAIVSDNRGPVFFRQWRVGRNGMPFKMLKFRTMVPDAEQLKAQLMGRNEAQEGFFKIRDDPRITRVGRLLRRTSLDELPQLFNVLRGEMSLVGPRPLVPHEDERVQGWHRRRLELTPGMTGHWQLLGSTRVPLREMAAMDYLYAANWTLWTDVKILLRTVPYILARRGQ